MGKKNERSVFFSAQKSKMSRSRAWCFTLNNYTDAIVESTKAIECEYIIFGKEVAPTTGTPHLQGYVYFANPRMMSGVKKLLPGAHLETAKGNEEQNFKYCSKDGNENGDSLYEKGIRPSQGKRTDIDTVKEMVVAKAPMIDIIMAAKSFQAVRFAQVARLELMKDRTEAPTVLWRWGLTGVGKTRY